MRSVELFAGCGGLALGLARAGFSHALVVELNDRASATLRGNQQRGVAFFADWPLVASDVRRIDYSPLLSSIDLVAGGPPCQPFSIGGKHLGPDDDRNMWPEAIRAVRELQPKAFIFENVRGLLRPAFADYLDYLKLHLTWPDFVAKRGESWTSHLRRLRRHMSDKESSGHAYSVVMRGFNAADYGAPQKRHRMITVGIRADLAARWSFPEPTHSRDALLWDQFVTGAYWERHALPHREPPDASSAAAVVARLLKQKSRPKEKPWVTVRDAIGDLPKPLPGREPLPNHRLHPGARVYPKHTGSSWDEPSKALKAGDHGVPGGENILALEDGSVRYFTLREMARLQGFPDDFIIEGSWKHPIKQLGNAVPVQVGEVLGNWINDVLTTQFERPERAAA